jgi:hypothetical protein
MILAIDPGVTTGFATEDDAYQIRFDEHDNPHRAFWFHLVEISPKLIIYEAFHWRQGQLNTVFKGVEYIGVINLWSQLNDCTTNVINPSDGKGFWDNKKLKDINQYVPGCPHGMDAKRLLLTWKMRNQPGFKSEILGRLKDLGAQR